MGYSTKTEVIKALANALSEGSPASTGLTPIITNGNLLSDTVTDSDLYQFIRWADENINASLSNLFSVPFHRVNRGTLRLGLDVTAGDTQLILEDATILIPEDVVLIRDDVHSQELEITGYGTSPETIVTVTPVLINSYLALDTSVERIGYPDPIPKISARMAAANLYDKYFSAQVEANQSDYGKNLRKLAYDDINAILSGTIRLSIPDANMYMGRRYYNHALDDAQMTKAEPGKKWFEPGV